MNSGKPETTRTTILRIGQPPKQTQTPPAFAAKEIELYHVSEKWAITLTTDGTVLVTEVGPVAKKQRLDNAALPTPAASSALDTLPSSSDALTCKDEPASADMPETLSLASSQQPRPHPCFTRTRPTVVPARSIVASVDVPPRRPLQGPAPAAAMSGARSTFRLMWDCSPELVKARTGQVLYVVDVFQRDVKALTSQGTQVISWGKSAGLTRGEWAKHPGAMTGKWERYCPTSDTMREFSARLLSNVLADPRKWPSTSQLKDWNLREKVDFGRWYEFEIESTCREVNHHFVKTKCGQTLKLEGSAKFLVEQLPRFHWGWANNSGFKHLPLAAVSGKLTQKDDHIVIHGVLRLSLTEETVRNKLAEFHDDVALVIRQLLHSRL